MPNQQSPCAVFINTTTAITIVPRMKENDITHNPTGQLGTHSASLIVQKGEGTRMTLRAVEFNFTPSPSFAATVLKKKPT